MADPQHLGSHIRQLRRAAGLSQIDLAGGNLSPSYISLLEAGKRTPSDEVLHQLAERLGCEPEALLRHLRADQPDPERLQIDLRYAEISLRNGDPKAALEAYTAVRDRAPENSQDPTRLAADLGVAEALEHDGRLEEAIGHYEALLARAGRGATLVPRLKITVALCRCYRELGNLAHAIDVGTAALAELEALQLAPTVLGVELVSTLVGLHCERGDLHRAGYLAGNAIGQAEAVSDRKALGAAYWNASVVAHRCGDTGDALTLIERALAIYAEGDDARALARLRNAYAVVLLQSDTPDVGAARDQLNRSAELLADHGSTVDQAYCHTALARAELLDGEGEAALEHARQALELLGDGHRLQTARALLVMAAARFHLGRDDAAEADAERAALLLEASDAGRQAASAWNDLAEIMQVAGHAERAAHAYQQSLRCLGQRSDLASLARRTARRPRPAEATASAEGTA
ncbi:helix-turn-helix domain-containing protein [Streptacidiphilus neutrinimicus]|uniref:helix-turn-helix domain-containing protein n=1 Tax=Streptacidiphilus neutrinimicus TaxID=105420 RepID=UPI0007C7CED2|nr:helix-turn-helix domain-containing protein [Streptacidiphilus neutrinimicus]